MSIACVRIPYFAAAVERRRQSDLLRQPLVIGGQPWQVRPVYATSAETVRYGVQRGVPLRQAYDLCPHAAFLPAAAHAYQRTVGEVDTILQMFTDRVEPRWTYPATVYYVACADEPEPRLHQIGQLLGRMVRDESGLPPAVGIGTNKFIAYMAAKLTQPHHLRVAVNEADAFLAAVPLRMLSLDPALQQRLRLFGLTTLADVAVLPAADVAHQFGRAGAMLHQLARGVDPRPVSPPPRELSHTQRFPFDDAIVDYGVLERIIGRICTQFADQLREQHLAAEQVRLRLVLEDGNLIASSATLPQPVQDAHTLQFQLNRLLHDAAFTAGVVDVEATMAALQPVEARQLSLFDLTQGASSDALEDAVAVMSDRYGSQVFVRAEPLQTESRVPERRYKWRKVAGSRSTAIFPRSAENRITPIQQQPSDQALPEDTFVGFIWQGRRYTIASIIKAWRVEHGWWEQHVRRDYYKLMTRDGLLLTILYDRAEDVWFVERLYD